MKTQQLKRAVLLVFAFILWAPDLHAQLSAELGGELYEIERQQWTEFPMEDAVAMVRRGMESADARNRLAAFGGLVHVFGEDPELARSEFDLSEVVRDLLHDGDDRVVEVAMMYAHLLVDDVEEVENAIVGRALLGGELFEQGRHIQFLEYRGLVSQAARDYLTSLTEGPISARRYSATRALLQAAPSPPESLLPGVMELIRSAEYFCNSNLIRHLPKFGSSAAAYTDELRSLRGELEVELLLPPDDRSVRITNQGTVLSVLDSAIAALEGM